MSVPELLFNPTAVGLSQAGIVEATAQSLQCLDLVSLFTLCKFHSCSYVVVFVV
jgi:hypothetical protein